MRTHLLGMLALVAVSACTRPGSEFLGTWSPVASPARAVDHSLVGEETLKIRRDGDRFYVTMDGSAVPAHLTQEGQLKVDGLIPFELSYSKEQNSLYLLGVQMQRIEQ